MVMKIQLSPLSFLANLMMIVTSLMTMMMMTNFLHPGILTPFSFMREHQTPLLPAPDNEQLCIEEDNVDEEEYNIYQQNDLLDSNIVFEPNGSEGYREKCFHVEKVQSLRVVPQDVLQNWDCLISPQRHTGFSLAQFTFFLFHL